MESLSFDVVVIGSGYGASVYAYRCAEAGLKVAILEKGVRHKAPNMPRGVASEWDPKKKRFGPHTITHIGKDVTAWTGTAFGGGSIVNAAVMIRKDNFDNWPGGITAQSMAPYYERAERMLEARRYPLFTHSAFADTRKTREILATASKLDEQAVRPPVAITYGPSGTPLGTKQINQHGATQQTCIRCGECSLPGCNYGAKNSLDYNYLFGAEQRGARVFTGVEVDVIYPGHDGVYYIGAADAKCPYSFEAKVVVVAAGCLGSSRLLLRNKHLHKTLPGLSTRLGSQYTTNGTFIGFAVRSKRELDPSGGPEITAGLDFQGEDGKSQGHLIFDGSFREFSFDTFYITGRLVRLSERVIRVISHGFKAAEKLRIVKPKTTLPLLVIGRDAAVGRFFLKDGELRTDLEPRDNTHFYAQANRYMKRMAGALEASLLRFPFWAVQRKIDVPHNLGGVPMGTHCGNGVVDHLGRVFHHRNLIVMDGSIIPSSLGANPALTIAALAERSAEATIAQLRSEGSISASEEKPPTDRWPQDLTVEFIQLYTELANGRIAYSATAADDQKKVLWVPGLLARHMKSHSHTVLNRLRARCGYTRAVPVDTDVATAANVEMIKGEIRQLKDGQGILIGHSRGGIMILDAYRQLSPDEKKKVHRIVLVQSPVNGAPIADFLIGGKVRRWLTARATKLIFGNDITPTLRELSVRGRDVVNHTLPELTDEDRQKILTFRSIIAPRQSPSFDLTRAITARYGQRSDGLTPHGLSEIPGTADVTLSGYDHEMLVVDNPGWFKRLTLYRPSKQYRSGDVIEALVRLACQMSPPVAAADESEAS